MPFDFIKPTTCISLARWPILSVSAKTAITLTTIKTVTLTIPMFVQPPVSFALFSRFEGEEGAFEFTHQQLAAKAREAYQLEGITELHIVGGLHPTYTFEWYEEMLRVLKQAVPGIHLKCFTGVEINFFAEKYNMTHEEILTRLKAAGLGSMPGGGAEIFHPDVREEICPGKGNAEQWLAVHRTAHRLGMRTNATMLYGHIETYEHRVDHMSRLRKLQDETGGFQTFIPLAFHPDHTQMDHFARPSGVEDLKTLAIGRVYLDNFDHIKAYWISMGVRLAQLSLGFGWMILTARSLMKRFTVWLARTRPKS